MPKGVSKPPKRLSPRRNAQCPRPIGCTIASCARVLDNLADAFERNRGELIKIRCTENGKIQREASFEVDLCAPSLPYFAGIAR